MRRALGVVVPDFQAHRGSTDYVRSEGRSGVRISGRGYRHTSALYENLSRMTGVTGFRVRYPGTSEPLLGIRFDISLAGQFSVPHYVIIRLAPRKSPFSSPLRQKQQQNLYGEPGHGPALEIFQHTVPAFLPLHALAQLYLNTNLKVFVRRVRSCLVLYAIRAHVFSSSSSHTSPLLLVPGSPVAQVQTVDPAFLSVRLEMQTGQEVVLDCAEDKVVRARILPRKGSSSAGSGGAMAMAMVVQSQADWEMMEVMRGGIWGLPGRLAEYYGA